MGPWAFGVFLILVSTLGLLLNGYVLLVVLGLNKQTQQQQTSNTLLLIHLGAVEAAVCLILLIFATGPWPVAGTWCVLHGFLLALLHPVALWTVTGLNCDRHCQALWIDQPQNILFSDLKRFNFLEDHIRISSARKALHFQLNARPWVKLIPRQHIKLCLADFHQPCLAITLCRYYAIAAPLHYAALVSPRRVIVGLAASWTGALLLCLPPFSGLVPPYKFARDLRDNFRASFSQSAPERILIPSEAFVGGIAQGWVAAPRISGTDPPRRSTVPFTPSWAWDCRPFSAIYEVTLSAQVTITHQRNPFFVPTVTAPSAGGPPRFHSAASTVMQLVGSLYLLYFPYCGLILWEACDAGNQHRLHAHPKLASLASLLLACSPPINGLLYGLKSQTLRRSVQNYWRKKATKSELQQEIQARTPSVAGSRRPSGSGNASFFPFPPLQRRLSEALLALGSCRTGGSFESNNLGFQRGRLQPAASCNTLRVPTAESASCPFIMAREGEPSKLVRASASAASLMGPHYRSDFIGADSGAECSIAMCETPRRSPRILITRAYSEESQDGGSPLLRKPLNSNTNPPPCEKRRWRHCSTGSESSTGSSDASVWTTGVTPKYGKGNAKNSDGWSSHTRHVRGKNLEEGALSTAIRPNNNSESSDTTDTTTATTTTTTLLKSLAMETGEQNEKEKERVNGNMKKREFSESESSWSSVEEIETKAERNDEDDNLERSKEGPQTRPPRRKLKSSNREPEVSAEDHEEAAQLRPLLTPSS
ncbi:Uncharacterized protein DBV15_10763 [Temnothorax longispinosus]|uniref:G-protein coupled receptors family 1 profile domain-containing protein n=1 Tax=Temnothorax longispinosus TaxID=300112 RepID=A0A4S2KH98_9HYME|nr:Uncharacterized protein DBV15_10763 [Temnothorax longispinosus]